MDPLYTAVATSTGAGRAGGRAASDDGALDVTLAVPQALGGRGGGTNPEQLFAAGWAACFHSALKSVAAAGKTELGESSVTAEVGLVKDGQAFGLQAALAVHVDGLEQDAAEALVEQAHQVCPYSNATRGNIEVVLRTTTGARAA